MNKRTSALKFCLAFVLLPYPIFNYILSGIGYGELVAVQMLFAVLISMFSGPGPAAIAEIFPTSSRSTWMTSGYALAVAIWAAHSSVAAERIGTDRASAPVLDRAAIAPLAAGRTPYEQAVADALAAERRVARARPSRA